VTSSVAGPELGRHGAMEPVAARPRPSVERRAVATVWLALVAAVAAAATLGVVAHALDRAIPAAIVAVLAPIALVVVAIRAGAARAIAARLPLELDGWFHRRRVAAALWAVLAVAAVANTARLGIFMADRSQIWASAVPFVPDLAHHECLPAYVRAGELAARGQDNLWSRADYGDDAYEYPPPFAVAGRAAVAITDDYDAIRAAWYGIGGVAFLIVALALAAWVGGRAGGTGLLLVPALMLSTPVLVGLQFGQAHLLVVVAAVAALPLFARDRVVAGGALLGLAIATKIFPGLLLVHLAVRRQWRAIAATLASVAVLFALAAVVLGPGTIRAFATEHLPAIASGDAFPNAETNYDNHSPYGLVFKLGRLGVAGMDRALASRVAWAYGLALVALVVLAARERRDRAGETVLWLAVLCLATLRSPFAPTYSAVTTLWLLTFVRWRVALVVIAWLFIQGQPPLLGEKGDVLLSILTQSIVLAIPVVALLRRSGPRPTPA